MISKSIAVKFWQYVLIDCGMILSAVDTGIYVVLVAFCAFDILATLTMVVMQHNNLPAFLELLFWLQ